MKEYVDRAIQTVPSPYLDPAVVLAARRGTRRRCPPNDRRIVSMPENKCEPTQSHAKRVVSMPSRVLAPSVELFHSPSTSNSYGIPQTPSPPSSPESLLIIAAGTQLPDGFLRRKYSPEPLIEEDEDWIAWANSPPRPIPALHGPLSLPYARCPSGAEGTIIEEPANVAQMIWGLRPDDQPRGQHRAEDIADSSQYTPSHGPNQAPTRLQKKRGHTLQVPNSARPNPPRTQRQPYIDESSSQSQVPSDIQAHRDLINPFSWNDMQPIPTNVAITSDGVLEWEIARLQQALRTSLADMGSYSDYPGRLEPVIPASVASGLSQSYPRIFVEPRFNDVFNSSTDISQQSHRQAPQKQTQNVLPTPPNSSSPQWSSRFSPYHTYCSTFSPESAGSSEHPLSVRPQKHHSGASASQLLRNIYEQHENDNVGDFNTTSFTKIPQSISNVHPAAPLRQSLSSSSTLAKYIKRLQALSPIAHLSPLQPTPPTNDHSPPVYSTDKSTSVPLRNLYSSPAIPIPLSPESPQTLSRRSLYHSARLIPSGRSMQQRLSSVPEEDSALLEHSMSVFGLQNQVAIDSTTGHQTRYLEVPCADITRKSANPELESTPYIAVRRETSPLKVRLPATKDHGTQEQTGGYQHHDKEGHQHGHKKKHRYRKLKGLANTSRVAPTIN